MTTQTETAIFGGGCFWCVEAVFVRLKGVRSVVSGYTGGRMENPTYEDVCSETTGHAEAIKVAFDPRLISYETLLDVFFATHDPTTLNRQGDDMGEQYRSAIFYTTDEQKRLAEAYFRKLEADMVFDKPMVTQLLPATKFYPAEDYHQQYYEKNPQQGYCQAVISPKVAKLRQQFAHFLKPAPRVSPF